MQKNCQHAKYLIFIVKSLANARIGILQVYIINLHVHINKSHININKSQVVIIMFNLDLATLMSDTGFSK